MWRQSGPLGRATLSLSFLASVACSSSPDETATTPVAAIRSRIELENEQPGTAYALNNPAEHHEIEGYSSVTSAVAGESVDLRVNVDASTRVSWELYRLGYYQGLGARLVTQGTGVEVESQPDCPRDPVTGLVECQWATAFSITVDPSWLTGYYLVHLTNEAGYDTTIPFVVREATPFAPVLVQASMNTWQAYNRWGGTSLYHDAQRVSYDRPYDTYDLPGKLFVHETYLVSWLEQHGVEVSYTTNIDVDRDPNALGARHLFVVSGHDEYWSLGERDALEQARDNGISLAILSANTGYWRVRLEPSSTGVDRRIVTCYKSTDDPERDRPDTTVRYRDQPDPRPENALTGVLYQLEDYPHYSLPLFVADDSHWVFEGTGVKTGDRLAVALGGEWDEPEGGKHEPTGVEFVLSSPAFDPSGRVATSAAALYEPTAHSFVFSAGTEEFAHALAEPHAFDRRAQRLLDNLLAHAGAPDPHPTPDLPPTPTTLLPGQVRVLAGSGRAGHRDGPGNEAEFDAPAGIALGPDGTLYVTDSHNHDVRAIAPDGRVSTLAGSGPHGARTGNFADGSARRAAFDGPTGIAVNADGVVFVADTGNNRIRAISNGKVTTFAGGSSGEKDGAGTHAQFNAPFGLTLGSDGSLFVVEPDQNSLRRIDPTGQVTTLNTDALAPNAVAVAPDGTVYVASPTSGSISAWDGNTMTKLTDADGIAGERVEGRDVHSLLDVWLRPSYGMAWNGDRLVFSDMGNNAVRALVFGSDPRHPKLETLAPETAPDDTLAGGEPAGLMLPRGIVPYADGYAVADTGHHRIVVVKAADPVLHQATP
jgi:sugar lactone lactonase YvrE